MVIIVEYILIKDLGLLFKSFCKGNKNSIKIYTKHNAY